MKMSVAKALTELKLVTKRMSKTIDESHFVSYKEGANGKVDGAYTEEEFRRIATSGYDSSVGLIKRYLDLKRAIVLSNATTGITVNGRFMTVAEGIERKASIIYDELLLTNLRRQYKNTIKTVSDKNETMTITVANIVGEAIGNDSNDSKGKPSGIDKIESLYKESMGATLADPLDIKQKIEDLENYIDGFKAEIDSTLTASNVNTIIEIED